MRLLCRLAWWAALTFVSVRPPPAHAQDKTPTYREAGFRILHDGPGYKDGFFAEGLRVSPEGDWAFVRTEKFRLYQVVRNGQQGPWVDGPIQWENISGLAFDDRLEGIGVGAKDPVHIVAGGRKLGPFDEVGSIIRGSTPGVWACAYRVREAWFVMTAARTWGPYEAVRAIAISQDGSHVCYLAGKGESWRVYRNGTVFAGHFSRSVNFLGFTSRGTFLWLGIPGKTIEEGLKAELRLYEDGEHLGLDLVPGDVDHVDGVHSSGQLVLETWVRDAGSVRLAVLVDGTETRELRQFVHREGAIGVGRIDLDREGKPQFIQFAAKDGKSALWRTGSVLARAINTWASSGGTAAWTVWSSDKRTNLLHVAWKHGHTESHEFAGLGAARVFVSNDGALVACNLFSGGVWINGNIVPSEKGETLSFLTFSPASGSWVVKAQRDKQCRLIWNGVGQPEVDAIPLEGAGLSFSADGRHLSYAALLRAKESWRSLLIVDGQPWVVPGRPEQIVFYEGALVAYGFERGAQRTLLYRARIPLGVATVESEHPLAQKQPEPAKSQPRAAPPEGLPALRKIAYSVASLLIDYKAWSAEEQVRLLKKFDELIEKQTREAGSSPDGDRFVEFLRQIDRIRDQLALWENAYSVFAATSHFAQWVVVNRDPASRLRAVPGALEGGATQADLNELSEIAEAVRFLIGMIAASEPRVEGDVAERIEKRTEMVLRFLESERELLRLALGGGDRSYLQLRDGTIVPFPRGGAGEGVGWRIRWASQFIVLRGTPEDAGWFERSPKGFSRQGTELWAALSSCRDLCRQISFESGELEYNPRSRGPVTVTLTGGESIRLRDADITEAPILEAWDAAAKSWKERARGWRQVRRVVYVPTE